MRSSSEAIAPALAALLALLASCGCGGKPATSQPAPSRTPQRADKAVYECRKSARPILVDGKLDEPAWTRAPVVELAQFPWWKEGDGPKQRTRVRLIWDDRFLYAGFDCDDADLLARATRRDLDVEKDDRVSVFLCPDPETQEYWCLEANAIGTLLDYRARIYRKFDLSWSARDANVATQALGTREKSSDKDFGYVVEMAIPWACLFRDGKPMKPEEATVIHVGLHRVDANTVGGTRREVHSMLRSPGTPNPEFHLLGAFGRLVLVAE